MNTIPIRKGTRTLVDLINRDNNVAFKYDELVLGDPVVIENKDKNTQVTVWSAKHTAPSDGVNVTYNRLEIEKVFKMMWGDDALFQLDVYNCTRLSAMLDTINKMYSLELTQSDVIDMEFDQSIPHVETIIQVSDKSHLYTGSIAVHLYTIDFTQVRITADGRIRIRGNDVSTIS
jgi:hypothetical protein